MRLLLAVLLAVGLHGAYGWWQERSATAELEASTSPNGFVPVEMPGGVARNTVLVLAPHNCPSEQAKRTEALVAELSRQGIPVTRGDSFAFDVENPTPEQISGIKRAVQVFKRGAPAVFVNGMAMSNPTASQTLAEYRSTRVR